jgi:hypothetical protein
MAKPGLRQTTIPAGDTDANVAYTWGYGVDANGAATHARRERITHPGGRQVYHNCETGGQIGS